MRSVVLAASLRLVVALICAALASPGCTRTPKGQLFSPDKAAILDEPGREVWQRPDDVVARLGLGPGAVVADIGAGTGYFAGRLSRAVGPGGKVFAVEVQAAFAEMLKKKAAAEGLANVQVVLGTPKDPSLPAKVDLAIFVNVYHELGDPLSMLVAVRKSLKPQGRVVIIDWRPDPDVPGPPPEERVRDDTVIAEALGARLVLVQAQEFLERQYFLVFAAEDELEAEPASTKAPQTGRADTPHPPESPAPGGWV